MAQKILPRSLRTNIWCRTNNALFAEKKRLPSLWALSLKALKDILAWTKRGRRYRPKRRSSRRLSKKNRLITFRNSIFFSSYGLSVIPLFYEYASRGPQWKYNPLRPRRKFVGFRKKLGKVFKKHSEKYKIFEVKLGKLIIY